MKVIKVEHFDTGYNLKGGRLQNSLSVNPVFLSVNLYRGRLVLVSWNIVTII